VLSTNERARDRLLASVEAALGTRHTITSAPLRAIPVRTRQLPPSGGHFNLDGIYPGAAPLAGTTGPVSLRGDEARFTGWAHPPDCTPDVTELYLALESANGGEDRIFRGEQRTMRPDVPVAFPQYSARCGFEAVAALGDVPLGAYHVAIVQRTPDATYRDATGVTVVRE